MTTYRLLDGPRHQTDDSSSTLTGFYRAVFAGPPDGRRRERFLTEGGRAELLDRLDHGQREFSHEEFEEMSVEPSMEALLARYDEEAGVGG